MDEKAKTVDASDEKHKAWCDLFDGQDICTCGLVDRYPWDGFGPKSPDRDESHK